MNSYPDLYTASHLSAAPVTANHLTDDQLDDHLIGDLAPAPAAHLAACSLCAQRVAAARSPLDSFHTVSTAWSERRSATLPIPVPAPPRPVWQRQTAWATACLALAFGLALTNASHQLSLQADTASTTPAAFAPPVQTAQSSVALQPVALTESARLATAPRAARLATTQHLRRQSPAGLRRRGLHPRIRHRRSSRPHNRLHLQLPGPRISPGLAPGNSRTGSDIRFRTASGVSLEPAPASPSEDA